MHSRDPRERIYEYMYVPLNNQIYILLFAEFMRYDHFFDHRSILSINTLDNHFNIGQIKIQLVITRLSIPRRT